MPYQQEEMNELFDILDKKTASGLEQFLEVHHQFFYSELNHSVEVTENDLDFFNVLIPHANSLFIMQTLERNFLNILSNPILTNYFVKNYYNQIMDATEEFREQITEPIIIKTAIENKLIDLTDDGVLNVIKTGEFSQETFVYILENQLIPLKAEEVEKIYFDTFLTYDLPTHDYLFQKCTNLHTYNFEDFILNLNKVRNSLNTFTLQHTLEMLQNQPLKREHILHQHPITKKSYDYIIEALEHEYSENLASVLKCADLSSFLPLLFSHIKEHQPELIPYLLSEQSYQSIRYHDLQEQLKLNFRLERDTISQPFQKKNKI